MVPSHRVGVGERDCQHVRGGERGGGNHFLFLHLSVVSPGRDSDFGLHRHMVVQNKSVVPPSVYFFLHQQLPTAYIICGNCDEHSFPLSL